MRDHRRRLVLGLLCTAQFVLVLDVTIVAVALPSVRERLGFSPTGLQWVISAYVLAFAGFLLLGGRAADLWGRRRLFMVGLAAFAGASAWCGLSRASWELVAARAVQGAGAAVVTPAALSLLTTTFAEGALRERALGVWTAAAAGGGATGFLLGGVMTQTLGWRAVFLVNVPVGAAGLVLSPVLLAEERITSATPLDLPGAATFTGAVSSLVYALSRVERGGPGSARTWLALAAAVLLGAAFVARERRAANPLIPPDALRHRGLVRASVVAMLLTGVTTPVALFSVLYLQDVLGYPPALAGVTVAPISVAVVAGSLAGSRLVGAGRLGAHRTMAAGLLGVALGAAGLATMAASGGLPPTMVAGFVLSGLGLGVASVASTAKGTAAVPPARQGLASGVLNTAAQVGTALGLAVLVTVASTRTGALTPPGARPSPAAVVGGYRWAILAGLAVALAAAGATAPRGGRCRSRRRAPPPGPNPAWLRGDKTMTKRYTPRTHVRSRARGLWRMAAEPGPEFRWGLVVRRSTLNQEGTEGSTERQRLVLTNHIKTNNMGRIVWTYKDIASAYKEDAKRPEFENAMLDLRAGRIDGIASWRPDRLVRRVSQFRQVMLDLEKSGGRLLFLRPMVIDTADTENLAFTTIFLDFLVAFAQMEAEATADRMVIWHQDRARQGLPHRSQVRPFGHTLDWFALVPHEAQLLNDAARRIIAGGNRFAICKEWEDSNFPTVLGKRWHGETLKQILMSPLMVGKREIGGTLHDMEGVPPILDMETWERVREALSNGKSRPGGRAPRRQASNIMVCGDCETPIVGNVEGPHSRETYVCRKRHAYPNACGGVSALVAHVDGEIANRVCEFLNQRDRVLTLLRQHALGAELDALHARNEQLNDSLVALDEARFNPPPGMPRLPDDRYWTQAAAIYAEQDQIQRKLAVTREASLLTETLSVDWTPELWGEQDLAWRRAILKLVTLSITLHKATKRGTRSGLYGSEFDPERVHVEFAS